jgi:hypothetical protein
MADLGPVLDGGLVPYAVAHSVGLVPRSPGFPLTATAAQIGGTRLLLVLDNCEHVVQSAAEVALWLLGNCPRLAILATSREPLQKFGMAASILLALLAWQDGELTTAVTLARGSLAAAGHAGDQWNIARALQLLAWAAAATGRPERAATLFGGAQSLLDSAQDDSDLSRLPAHRAAESQARLALGEASFTRRFAEGRGLSAADAVQYALNGGPTDQQGKAPTPARPLQ